MMPNFALEALQSKKVSSDSKEGEDEASSGTFVAETQDSGRTTAPEDNEQDQGGDDGSHSTGKEVREIPTGKETRTAERTEGQLTSYGTSFKNTMAENRVQLVCRGGRLTTICIGGNLNLKMDDLFQRVPDTYKVKIIGFRNWRPTLERGMQMTWYLKGTDPFYGGTSQGHLFDKGFFGVGKGDEVLGLQQLILGPNFCLTLEACSEDRRLASEVSLEGDPYSTQLSTQVTEDNLEGERESNALLAAPSSPLAPRKRGRPRKLRPPFCPPEKQDRGIQYGPKKRGRKPKGLPPHTDSPATEGSLSNLQSEAENSGQREALGRYFTRATKVWLLGKVLGLEFDGTDAQAVEGLDRELKSFLPGE